WRNATGPRSQRTARFGPLRRGARAVPARSASEVLLAPLHNPSPCDGLAAATAERIARRPARLTAGAGQVFHQTNDERGPTRLMGRAQPLAGFAVEIFVK